MADGDIDGSVVRYRDVREVEGCGGQGRGGWEVKESRLARNAGCGGGRLVGHWVDRQRPAPTGMAVDGRAAGQEAQAVEVGVALDVDQHLGVAAGHADVVENDV